MIDITYTMKNGDTFSKLNNIIISYVDNAYVLKVTLCEVMCNISYVNTKFLRLKNHFFCFSVDMRIFSFNLILAMDFLNKIAEFMTTGLTDVTPPTPKEEIKLIKSQTEKSAATVNVSKIDFSFPLKCKLI